MKKNIISTVIAGALFAVAGSAMALPNEAMDTATVTTTVRATSTATVTVTPNNGSISEDEITSNGIEVASVDVSASGLYDGTTGANIKLSVDPNNYPGKGNYWKMSSDA
ncbi:hypothetical protein K6712_25530 [Escherichia coli]|uniref:hypothetical protein n=1 Tax=Escherichia coli TaxID=562 RepID=UPI001C9A40D1|nr:hypothetical protein [Escherichia coli]MBY7261103.1 hypothetical protein [Escherichia coli]MBY7430005.1 hypothetical protein [Escherichia coli]MBY7532254.1 hypothetical protein [Escherichia coli]MBY7617950.1 hypothetical protein [Escherichia coli]MBY7627115.1 hypothetical protein [Escherichia coli]